MCIITIDRYAIDYGSINPQGEWHCYCILLETSHRWHINFSFLNHLYITSMGPRSIWYLGFHILSDLIL